MKTAMIRMLLVVFLFFAGSPLVYGAQPTIFKVKDVAVDVTAVSADVARTQALAKGQKIAFRQLLERLTLQAYHNRLPQVSQAQLNALIVDFTVAEEKTSTVRYIAKLDYRFRAKGIRALLEKNEIPYAETVSKPVLLLAIYQAAGALSLWADPNPWRAAWDRLGAVGADGGTNDGLGGLVPVVLPVGDLQDVRTIGAEQAVEGDMQRLRAISSRYNTGDIVVAHGILRMDSYNGRPELEVYLTRFGSTLQENTVVKTFSSAPSETVDQLLYRSARAMKAQLEDNWKQDNLIQVGRAQVLAVQVPVSSLADWVRVRDRLNGVAIVRRVDVVLMRRNQVRLNLNYIGDAEQLALSLDQADLALWEEGGLWYLGQKTQDNPKPKDNPKPQNGPKKQN